MDSDLEINSIKNYSKIKEHYSQAGYNQAGRLYRCTRCKTPFLYHTTFILHMQRSTACGEISTADFFDMKVQRFKMHLKNNDDDKALGLFENILKPCWRNMPEEAKTSELTTIYHEGILEAIKELKG